MKAHKKGRPHKKYQDIGELFEYCFKNQACKVGGPSSHFYADSISA